VHHSQNNSSNGRSNTPVKPLWLCNHDDDDLNLKYFDKPDIEIVKQLPAHYCKEEYFIAFTDRCKKDEKG